MGRFAASSVLLLSLFHFTYANRIPVIHSVVEQVREDTPKGGYAFTIDATDPENDILTYGIVGTGNTYFTVDSHSGNVTVKKELDREISDYITVTVSVADPHGENRKDLTIILLDANDNAPIFDVSSFDISVAENTPINTALFEVNAVDNDIGLASLVKYSIVEVQPPSGYNLFSINGSEIVLVNQLNYTVGRLYRLQINASDGGGEYNGQHIVRNNSALAFVSVKDISDQDPQFIGLPYLPQVKEHSELGLPVLTVTALDQDTGVNNQIIYSLENSTADGLFSISADTGIISVMEDIDREVIGAVVTLIIKATEASPDIYGNEASATASVRITIIDINDNTPEFYLCEGTDKKICKLQTNFIQEVSEHSLGSIDFNMTVKDLDQGGEIQLMLDGTDKDVFSVEPNSAFSESSVRLTVRDSNKLDFEKTEQMVVQVIAVDQEKPSFRSTATVTIKIKDVNDNSPKFPQDTFELHVPEHSGNGTVFATITAEDPDTMDEGKITYKLFPDSILSYFDVEPNTGAIYVKNEKLIDREVRSLYSATLQARDTNNNTGTTVLEITLTDINDKKPVFNRDSYSKRVEEGEQLDLPIEATDGDEQGTENSQIVYEIVPSDYSGNFTINPNTGVLRNNGELDREALDPDLNGMIELKVTATDKGQGPLSSMVTVVIDVVDVNDNTPQFKAASYKFAVKEGEKGAFVGSVHAVDLDQTTDLNRISFSIISGGIGSFMIRPFAEVGGYIGNITVDQDIELDFESDRKKFVLGVEATDVDQKTAVVTVEVDVVDVNDERPVFKPAGPLTVKENTTDVGDLGKFLAVDMDGNHSLVFELESIKCHCNGTMKPCSWFLLKPTGEITLNPEHTVDYELCDWALIEAQVVDEYTEKGENNSVTTGEMVINIEDINDNAPEFIVSDVVNVVVSESASADTSVAEIAATDRDSGLNKQVEFKVTEVRFEDLNNHTSTMTLIFGVRPTQPNEGIIHSVQELNTELKGKYLVTVTATDRGGLSTSTVVEVFTVDKSFKVELRFVSSPEEVTNNKEKIRAALSAATSASVRITTIKSDTAESRAQGGTIMEVYFIYSNGTAINSAGVDKMLSAPEHFPALNQLGLTHIGDAPVDEPPQNPLHFGLMGVVGGLVIVLTVLVISLVCTRRNYRTKLKAAKAMNSATMAVTENQKSGPVVPGTNKYTMEGANPVLNLNIDTATDLGFDEESSNADKVSLSSLDYNIDMTMSEKDPRAMTMIQEEDEEEDNGEPRYIEPLGAALAQRGNKKGSDKLSFDNPAFSTTDL